MHFDLIVVGGGHNGLVCAAYAARAGLAVAVLERHERVGGAAITEEFYPGFKNSAASYTVSLLEPRVINDLELKRHGLTIVRRPLDNFVPALDGPGLELPADMTERLNAIASLNPADADAYGAFTEALDAAIRLVRPFFLEAPVEPTASLGEFRRALSVAARSLGHGHRAIRALLTLFRRSAGDWLDGYFDTDLLKGGLGFDSIVGHFASPYARGSGYLLLHHALGEIDGRQSAWGHAIGGMGSISNALAKACTLSGVRIFTGENVTHIAPDGGMFRVETADRVMTGRRIAAALHPQRLFLELLSGVSLPPAFHDRIKNWRSESASFRINVALSELPDFRSLPGKSPGRHHGSGILISPSLAYLDDAYRDACASGISSAPVIEMVIPSTIDTTLAPRGRHVASLFCQHFRYVLPEGKTWDQLRDEAVDRILETIDRYAPNFRASVLGLKAYSPLDLERRFGLIGGDIFHGAMTAEQLYRSRPAKGYARYRTPVPGLYLCAAGAHPGGGVSGAPGFNAAAAIVEDCRLETVSRQQ